MLTLDDVMGGMAITCSMLVFDDDDYYMGGVLAETHRLCGHAVTLMTRAPLVSAWTANTLEQENIQRRVLEAGIEVVANANLVSMRAGEVDLACIFTGRQQTRRADHVLLVTARLPNASSYDGLAGAGSLTSLVRIGDCMAPGTIAYAVFGGRRAAEALDEPVADIVSFRTEPVATEKPLRQPPRRLLAAA